MASDSGGLGKLCSGRLDLRLVSYEQLGSEMSTLAGGSNQSINRLSRRVWRTASNYLHSHERSMHFCICRPHRWVSATPSRSVGRRHRYRHRHRQPPPPQVTQTTEEAWDDVAKGFEMLEMLGRHRVCMGTWHAWHAWRLSGRPREGHFLTSLLLAHASPPRLVLVVRNRRTRLSNTNKTGTERTGRIGHTLDGRPFRRYRKPLGAKI
jgi:hypothetical protein